MATYTQKLMKPKRNLKNVTKHGENMCQTTLNKHAKFHGDGTIGGSITVKRPSKTQHFYINDLKLQ